MTTDMIPVILLVTVLSLYCGKVSTECTNIYSKCEQFKHYCHLKGQWEEYMSKYCQKSCPKHCKEGPQCGQTWYNPASKGIDVSTGGWPWLVSVNYRGRPSHICGGSLVSPTFVLTSSSCLKGKQAKDLEIIAGEHRRYSKEGTEQYIKVLRIILHPNYNEKSRRYDIALLELEKAIKETRYVKTICLADNDKYPAAGTKCYFAGWGTMSHYGTTSPILRQAMLPIIDNSYCYNTNGNICAGSAARQLMNSCRGDKGGPIMCKNRNGRWVQHGVASFSVNHCNYFAGFSSVAYYRNWLREHIKE